MAASISRWITDVERAQADDAQFHADKVIARSQATKDMVDHLETLRSDINTKGQAEISAAAEKVKLATTIVKEMKEASFPQDQIQQVDDRATKARRDLAVKLTKWDTRYDLVQHMIAHSKSAQRLHEWRRDSNTS